jgi:hypothetical protein
MALTSAGITNGGRTTHYQFQYDDSLSGSPEPARTNAVIAACEGDFNLMSGWFGNIKLDVNFPISVNVIPPGLPGACANNGGCATFSDGNLNITISDQTVVNNNVGIVRYLMIAEIVENFMRVQGLGWFGSNTEGSQGEGLSRFLSAQFFSLFGFGNPPNGYLNSNIWLLTPQ